MTLLDGIKLPGSTSLAVAGGACIAGGVLGGLIIKNALSSSSSVDTLPEKWVKVGKITELIIYPVKSLQGVSVKEAVLANLGLKGADNALLRDRVFLIVDQEGIAVGQKKIPMLALIKVEINGNKLQLAHTKDPSTNHITVDIPTSVSSTTVATVMGEKIKNVVDCGDEVASWLCKVTGTSELRLVYHIREESQRGSVTRNSKFHTYRGSHTGAFHDETSYMIMSDESIAALNEHLGDQPVSHKHFRPTIAVGGLVEPFAEDFWGYIRFGDRTTGPVMKNSIPCQRCKLTTVNPDTGEFRTDGEPLRTLYKLKGRPVGDEKVTQLVSKSAVIGVHFGVFDGEDSVVRVGDPVYAALL